MNYLEPSVEENEINKISILGLAHIGDCVYELLTRTYLCTNEHLSAHDLHKTTVSIVNAPFQAEASRKILPELTEDELAVFKRGRNAKVNSVPSRATVGEYHAATGLEALFGWLYLKGEKERLNALFKKMMDIRE